MIAAYAFGITIEQETVEQCSFWVPACGVADTGVAICYNSVRDASCVGNRRRSAVTINSVSWRTDETPAVWTTEP